MSERHKTSTFRKSGGEKRGCIMRIILIETKAPGPSIYDFANVPRLGLPLLAAILTELGHEVRVYVESLSPVDWTEVKNAGLVGFSTITSTAPAAYMMCGRVRKMGIPTVIGGSHATFLPEEALQYCDFVVRGEGQKTLPMLVEALENSATLAGISGLSYNDDLQGNICHNPDRPPCTQEEFTGLPTPALGLIAGHERISFTPVMTSWGCPHNCDFCSVVPMFGRKMRFRPVEAVLDELEILNSSYVFFYDDNFVVDKQRTKAILRGIIERGLKLGWSAQMRAQAVFTKSGGRELDRDLLELMRLSGCKAVYNGFESVNQATLDAYEKHQSVSEISDAIDAFHQYDIHVHGMFVLGADTDGIRAPRETANFALKHGIDTVQLMVLTPFPGTRLRQRLSEQNRLLDIDWSHFDGHFCTFKPKQMNPAQLQKLSEKAMKRFYSLRRSMLILIRSLPRLIWRMQRPWLRELLSGPSRRIQDVFGESWEELKKYLRLPLLRLYAVKQMLGKQYQRRIKEHMTNLLESR